MSVRFQGLRDYQEGFFMINATILDAQTSSDRSIARKRHLAVHLVLAAVPHIAIRLSRLWVILFEQTVLHSRDIYGGEQSIYVSQQTILVNCEIVKESYVYH